METIAIQPEEVVKKINDTLAELQAGVEANELSETEKSALLKKLKKLEDLALSIKRKISD